MFKKQYREQKGQAFIIVLILMLVSALLITPLLSYQYSGWTATKRNENRMMELYTADAGIEDALLKIRTKNIESPNDLPDTIGEAVLYDPGISLNGRTIDEAGITYVNENTFKMFAAAASSEDSGTYVMAYTKIYNFFTNLLNNAITSPGYVEVGNNSQIIGDIQTPDLDLPNNPNLYDWSGNWKTDPIEWPPYAGIDEFYMQQIRDNGDSEFIEGDYTITLAKNEVRTIDPMYIDGELEIRGPNNGSAELILSGPVYVTGGVSFNNKNLTLRLGNTSDNTSSAIYLEGQGYSLTGIPKYSIYLPPTVTLVGPGSIISEKAIYFRPNITTEDFIFVISLLAKVNFQPGGDFVGSIAGDVTVNLQPGNSIEWTEPPPYLNLPGSDWYDYNVVQEILSWNSHFYDPSQITITSADLAAGNKNVPYSQDLTAIGGIGNYSWYITPGTLPAGLSLIGNIITGTPTTIGTTPFETTVTDEAGRSTVQPLEITVNELTVTTTDLANGWVDVPGYVYSRQLEATSGDGNYSWSLISGSLPPGLTLASNGNISGTPTATDNYSFTVRVRDGVSNTADKPLSITIYQPPTVVTNDADPIGFTNATLNGIVENLGNAPNVRIWAAFEWRLDGVGSYSGSIEASNPAQPMTTVGTSFSANTGNVLTLSTSYYYRVKALVSADDGATVEQITGGEKFFKTNP